MAVDEEVSSYSTAASSNDPAGTATVGPDLDNHLRDMKKNIRAVGQTFLGSSEGNFDGAMKVDNSASPTWTLGINYNGTFISLFDVDVSANTSTPYGGSSPSGSFAQEYLPESTGSARSTIMGSRLGAVAAETGTASASHVLALQGVGPPIGAVEWTIETSAPDGWLFLNADTLGNLSASATHAGAIYEVLYTKIWDSTAQAQVPVESGRGASAAADWAANKYLRLPDARGRSIIGTGTGFDDVSDSSTLTARTNADFGGEETHTLTTAEMPSHTHTVSIQGSDLARADGGNSVRKSGGSTNTGSTGSGNAHNTMQPWLALNAIIKY